MLCSGCFGAVFQGMKHCPWCGIETSSARPRTSEGLKCPRCTEWLARLEVNKLPVAECLRCGGLWVDSQTVQRVCDVAEDQETVLGMPSSAGSVQEGKQGPARVYVPCPVCGKLMNRNNFAGCSGVVVDWCKAHGSWFDKDELRRIVEFIRGGGMRKSRERQKRQIQEETERLKDQQRNLATLSRLDTSGRHSMLSLEMESFLQAFGERK
jgi:Zn-finger nucleic acid-binding protein